ncbi:MAG: hypothetical protein ACJZ2H_10275 [Acidimicrobiales bacterium]|nr:hypothetical protein [Acidimicrobiales bacterium]|tara:strand:+ start:187 stop:354 length:168 start_codon:yes stop_codon:yes gene_type:complete
MAVQKNCRHYRSRSLPSGDRIQKCRVGSNEEMPFACPEFCLFFEKRNISDAGWNR